MSDNTNTKSKVTTDPEAVNQDETQVEAISNFKKLKGVLTEKEKALKEKEELIKKYELAEQEREQKKLEEQGKFKELAESKDKAIQELKEQVLLNNKKNQIHKLLSSKQLDTEVIDLLEDKALSLSKTDDDGNITNLDEVISTLSTNYSSIFQPKVVKSAQLVSANGSVNKLTKDQALKMIADSVLYAKNREAIKQALSGD